MEKELIRRDYSNHRRLRYGERIDEIKFYIPKPVFTLVTKGKRVQPDKIERVDIYDFLELVETLTDDLGDNNITYKDMLSELKRLVYEVLEKPTSRKIRNLNLKNEDLLLFLYLGSQTDDIDSTIDLIRFVKSVIPDFQTQMKIRKEILRGTSELLKKDVVKLAENNFRNEKWISLTERGIEVLFGQDKDIFLKSTIKRPDIIRSTEIPEKHLFYNSEEQKNIDFLTNVLKQENFTSIRERLINEKMRPGFTVLFHGSAGTGKTESVYQICRATGRNLKLVIISETKSMWFGQSEKLIKNIFDEYRRMVKSSEVCPVLLFNECDGIFGTRKEVGRSPVAQTENAIQNIILQELEDLDGILIATSNQISNLDKAFERRFLFKIQFQKPSTEVKQLIWRDKIPDLTVEESSVLSERFDLSGGQIDNVVKKFLMKKLLFGIRPCLDDLLQFCSEELLEKRGVLKIGY